LTKTRVKIWKFYSSYLC